MQDHAGQWSCAHSVAGVRRPHELRPASTICRVHVEPRRSQQRRDRLGVASLHRLHERRLAITIFINVEARRSQQRRDRLGVASNHRPHERRPASNSCRVHVEARRSQQCRDPIGVASIRSPHERRLAKTIYRAVTSRLVGARGPVTVS